MERSKNAMYAQAEKNRGWMQKQPEEVTINIPAAPISTVMPPMADVPAISAGPMEHAIPMPPVVVAPEMPKAYRVDDTCQALAMAYVATGKWQELYDPDQGFERGTLFSELDLPFIGEGACKHG